MVDGEVRADIGFVISSKYGKISALNKASSRVIFLSDRFTALLAGSNMRGLFKGVDIDRTGPR